jgi:8-oxo-dGTP diphosphatase
MKKSDDKYEKPSVTVDVLLFTIEEEELKILLVKRSLPPFKDSWALPGGFVRIFESLEDAATRELKEESNVSNVYLEQLFTFGAVNRDPRERVITVTYLALADNQTWNLHSSGDAKESRLFSVKKLPKLAFDHVNIIDYGLQRLRAKLGYTNIVFGLLPEDFSLTDLQKVYEIILNSKLDKRNFRKKMLATGLLKSSGKKSEGVAHRPANY